MKLTAHSVVLFLAALMSLSCSATPKQTSVTRVLDLALYDTGFFGGQQLFVLSNGVAFARVEHPPSKSESGMQKRRFRIQLQRADLVQLHDLLITHRFFTLSIKDRAGIPDERRTILKVRLSDGQRREVAKWAVDKHEDFDPIYEHLIGIVRRAEKTKPIYSGPADDRWKPETLNK